MTKATAFILLSVLGTAFAWAQTDSIPSRAIVLTGDPTHPDHISNVANMYSRENLAFEDPDAPRFLFLDKQGKIALGIGGYLKAVGQYDFDGAVDNSGFYPSKIAVPADPAMRQRFGATVANSTIFLKLVTSPTRLGRIIVYIQTDFTGNNGGYGLMLKQGYVSIGHVTLGKARTTFADAKAMAPTIDDQGPAGQVPSRNMLVRYESPSYAGFSYGIGAEVPRASYTLTKQTESIAQRMPDIPAFIQYAWGNAASHLRLSGVARALSYRDLAAGENRIAGGWGVKLSTVIYPFDKLKIFGHYTYGQGISHYINDLAGYGFDLIPSSTPGRLKAPAAAGWTAGAQYNFTDRFFVSGAYSRAQLYDTARMDAATYRYGQYIVANAFYNVWDELRVGVEYLHGTRKNISGLSGKANRVEAMIQYSF